MTVSEKQLTDWREVLRRRREAEQEPEPEPVRLPVEVDPEYGSIEDEDDGA